MQKVLNLSFAIGLGLLFCIALLKGSSADLLENPIFALQPEQDSVDVRLARAHVKLAQLEVEKAVEANKRIANTYSIEYVELLKLHVLNDEAELEQSLSNEQMDAHEVCIKNGEATLRIAKSMLPAYQALYQKIPNSNTKFALDQALLRVEIAELELEQMKELQSHDMKSVLLHLQRQVDRLRDEVTKLQLRQ